MGTIQHDALIITAAHDMPFDRGDAPSDIEKAHEIAVRIFSTIGYESLVTPIAKGMMNGCASFLIAPDGSKEGWDTSTKAEQVRALVKQELRANVRNCTIVAVTFGEYGTSASSE